MPKISVCIPTYNRAHFLPFAIDSVFAQTITDWELIVCDDGSQDATPEVMARYTDPRVRYVRHPRNVGKSNNMRSGFEVATGKYFIKFDDDDRLTPEFLEKTSEILDRDSAIDFVGTDHWIIDSNNDQEIELTEKNSQKWGRTELAEGISASLLETVFVRQSFQVGATLFRMQALQDVDYMRPNIQNCEDNDLFVRLVLDEKQGYYLPQRLMEYRVHPEQQGLDRAIPYLKDKLSYLENFQFTSKLEEIRRSRLAETQLLLGLRLIEIGDVERGRELVRSGKPASVPKAYVALALSLLPKSLRQTLFQTMRKMKE
ncbi:MAG: glycosyltransferase family 2 protein [Phormidium tanganyikae FI6-MK23]|jgi:glycosyltransferase involved in cell wall biosynthesis|nr:glycosyltransferase family 2 protein [Phormidium tanganyikae FI6-MK23]